MFVDCARATLLRRIEDLGQFLDPLLVFDKLLLNPTAQLVCGRTEVALRWVPREINADINVVLFSLMHRFDERAVLVGPLQPGSDGIAQSLKTRLDTIAQRVPVALQKLTLL
ncbi:hypothetical protein L540_11995 [Bordetella pseudohinzii]|uniref:Uncharacterized protein n=1 Tax=Bordetella pseudohinzii TaxID=1331258 RepID=A0ABM6DA86_9BORD|nr:hypothetical protein BBN53_00095 [Bordetella pseudohinzii]KMM26604.1 hypothetical protein L540_11995 [Bordetella pseudohinzii]KXA80963.1 hypothetical protein AW877_05140 [Bordetella pseudohinzii]